MPTKAVQQFMLGTVLSNENEARQTLAAMKAAGYGGIELCGFMIHPIGFINDRGTRISGSAVTPILKTDSMELGTGNMDLDSLMAQALTIGVDAVILESHRNWVDNSPVKSLQVSAEYLKQYT